MLTYYTQWEICTHIFKLCLYNRDIYLLYFTQMLAILYVITHVCVREHTNASNARICVLRVCICQKDFWKMLKKFTENWVAKDKSVSRSKETSHVTLSKFEFWTKWRYFIFKTDITPFFFPGNLTFVKAEDLSRNFIYSPWHKAGACILPTLFRSCSRVGTEGGTRPLYEWAFQRRL